VQALFLLVLVTDYGAAHSGGAANLRQSVKSVVTVSPVAEAAT